MSWLKKRSESKNSLESGGGSGPANQEKRTRHDTDPATCLEVFQNHWEQACVIINRNIDKGTKATEDEVNAVSHNFEQMITLLAAEKGEDGQGMPGPILHYLLEHEILEKFCSWCHSNHDSDGKLLQEQLRMFESLLSQAHQLLLIHKPVIRPLLTLIAYCSDDNTAGIESSLVLVLHQLCVSISKETVILESVFNMNADHGPTKFLIFSKLIPFLHREGKVGQQARDALLLIMTLSAKHPYIGEYIAENSDFCPVLATGLSGLYSDLPRKITIPSEDWCQITDDDVQHIPMMSMFLNSLEFCNAVAQIAHPLVREQLIRFIYNGFLVPVLGPALHQNSREEVITATAYLDLFLRKISEPCLVKAFLMFIFTEKYDEIVILDSLITRINSSSKLCLVSLSLFYTLVDLNCEDVMFDLVFKYLIPCTHVMISQRRSLRDHDIYCKSAEKFLSLRPTCCLPEIDSPKHNLGDLPGLPKLTNKSNSTGVTKIFKTRKDRKKQVTFSEPSTEVVNTAFPVGTFGSKLEHFETTYLEYLQEAHFRLEKCWQACKVWQYSYDSENPPPSCLAADSHVAHVTEVEQREAADKSNKQGREAAVDRDNSDFVQVISDKTNVQTDNKAVCDTSSRIDSSNFSLVDSAINNTDIDYDILKSKSKASMKVTYATEEDFLKMLDDSESPTDKSVNIEDSVQCLDTLLSSVSASISRTSTPRKDVSKEGTLEAEFGDESEMSTVYFDCESSKADDEEMFKSISETSFDVIDNPTKGKTTNATDFEIIDSKEQSSKTASKTNNVSSFVDISTPASMSTDKTKQKATEEISSQVPTAETNDINIVDNHYKASTLTGILVTKSAEKDSDSSEAKGDKSVRFAEEHVVTEFPAQPNIGVGMTVVKTSSTPNIGPFLTVLLQKLDGMMQNSLTLNLLLTGLISRLAVYHQPLLRSFLLNHNLVFQPTVKSLVQVLTAVRQKVDHFSYTVQNFEALLLRARRTLAHREGLLPERGHSLTPSPELIHNKGKAATTATEVPSKEKRPRTLTDLLFKRNNKKLASDLPSPSAKLEILAGNKGMRYVKTKQEEKREQQVETLKTRHAVYCAIVLEEFVKELAALSQEHALLLEEEEWCER